MAKPNKTADKITQIVIDALKKGTIPWRRPWRALGEPRNFVSNRPYRGVNWFVAMLSGYADPRFMTYKQATARGWRVRRGEHGIPIVFYSFFESNTEFDSKGKPKKIPFLRHFTVFNVSQIDGDIPKLDMTPNADAATPIDCCEAVVENMPLCPPIQWDQNKAFYSPSTDSIGMPPRDLFDSAEEVYSTLFHELVHATGHKDRIGRNLESWSMKTGSYAREELIAEMGAAMLCHHCGIDCKTLENSAAYIANWLKRLDDDHSLVIKAASAGQKAFDWILDRKPEKTTTEETTEETELTPA